MPQTSVPYLLATLLTLVAVPVMADHGVAWHLGANEPALSSSSARAPEDRRTIADSLAQLSITGQGSPYGEFLDPDIAFVPSLEVRNARALLARWEIAEGYYLYRDKLGFRLLEPEGAKLGAPAVLFFGADGEERGTYRMVGYMDAELFRKHARGALSS